MKQQSERGRSWRLVQNTRDRKLPGRYSWFKRSGEVMELGEQGTKTTVAVTLEPGEQEILVGNVIPFTLASYFKSILSLLRLGVI